MKKSDVLTSVGLVLGIVLMLYGMLMGSSLRIFWDFSSVLITGGGSISALLITYSLEEVMNMGKLFVEAFKEKSSSGRDIIERFSILSKKARREGLLSLEDDISEMEDPFLKKGLQISGSCDIMLSVSEAGAFQLTLGCRQAVRHQTLTLAFVGSNPAIPARVFIWFASSVGRATPF